MTKQLTGQMRQLLMPKSKWWMRQSVVAFLSEKLRRRNQIEIELQTIREKFVKILFFIIHPECEVKIELRSERKKAKKSCQKNEKETKLKQGEKNRKNTSEKVFPTSCDQIESIIERKKNIKAQKRKMKRKIMDILVRLLKIGSKKEEAVRS